MPTKEDREDAGEARAATTRPIDAARDTGDADLRDDAGRAELPGGAGKPATTDAARPESISTRVFTARWSVVAGVCLLVAALLLLAGRMDGAFVAATLGVVAWFWNERNRLRPGGIEGVDKFQDEDEEFKDRDEE